MGLWLLLVFAVVGTIYILNNPFVYLARVYEGKQVGDIYNWLDKNRVSGCAAMFLILLLTLLYTFFIEPFVALFALTNNVGPRALAIVVLAVAMVNVVNWSKTLFVDVGKSLAAGEEYKREVLTSTKRNKWLDRLRYTVASLPIFYMWFVWLVLVGVIKF